MSRNKKLSVRNERCDSFLLRIIIPCICPRASDEGEPARSGTGGRTRDRRPQVNTRRERGRPINRSEAEVDPRGHLRSVPPTPPTQPRHATQAGTAECGGQGHLIRQHVLTDRVL